MKRFYVIYLTLREDDSVTFSSPYSSFNSAKDNIDYFLEEFSNKRGKKIEKLSKDELEKLKLNKKPEDYIYIRRKDSEATLFFRTTLTGTFYNSYIIERAGKIGISEFSYCFNIPIAPIANSSINRDNKEEIDDIKVSEIIEKKIEGIEKKSHGVHVNLISELKSVLSKRKETKIEEIEKTEKHESEFIKSLILRKNTLKNITPPPERKLIL